MKKKKIQTLEENGTWSLVDLPPGKNTVDSKWLIKLNINLMMKLNDTR